MVRKHCGEKEKLLIMRSFSFSHSVFQRLVLQTCKIQGLFGKGLTILHQTSHATLKACSSFYKLIRILVISNWQSKNSEHSLTPMIYFQTKNSEWPKLKEAADRELNTSQICHFHHKENNLENGGKTDHQNFLFFFLIVLKTFLF